MMADADFLIGSCLILKRFVLLFVHENNSGEVIMCIIVILYAGNILISFVPNKKKTEGLEEHHQQNSDESFYRKSYIYINQLW